MTLTDVLHFIQNTATESDKILILGALNGNPLTRHQKAANTLAQIGAGETVNFAHDGVPYQGIVQKINRTTATVKITRIEGLNRNRITVGDNVRVGASILARSL